MKYRLYIDEVGNHDLGSSDLENERFLSLTGVIASLSEISDKIHPELEELKVKYFGQHPDEPIVLHRSELRAGKPPFNSLKDPEVRSSFDRELLELLEFWNYQVITVCIDKKRHRDTYNTWHYHPYHYCLKILLERYIFFLDEGNSIGDVMAESRGGKEDLKLKDSFKRIWDNGTEFLDSSRFQNRLTSKKLKVKPKSNNIAGLQIADIIAHPSKNEILLEQGLQFQPIYVFGQKVIQILQSKYYQRDSNVYGKKFL